MASIERQSTLEAIEAGLSPEGLRWYRQFPKVRTRQGDEMGRDLAAPPKRPLWRIAVENTFWLTSGSVAFGLTLNPLAYTVIIPFLRNIKEVREQEIKLSGLR